MKFTQFFISVFIAACMLFSSCENTGSIGASLVTGQAEVIIDSTFVVTGKSVVNPKIQSRTTTQLLGKINAKGYGEFESEFVTEFMSSTVVDTSNVPVENIDSLRLIMRIPRTDIIGDSMIPMGLAIYPLTKKLPNPIYSDFDPTGYYDETAVIPSFIYKMNVMATTDTIYASSQRYITVKLPQKMARDLYNLYRENPSAYSTPQAFTSKFPGFYIKNTYGDGRVVSIEQTVMRMHYHKNTVNSAGRDTTINYVGYYYGVQPEIISNNIIDYKISPELTARLNNGENIIVAPAGRDMEITFPIKSIIDSYLNKSGKMSVLNTLSFRLPAETITNNYDIVPPPALLLILSKDKDKFFIENKVTDDVTSFVGTYNSVNKCYDFAGMRDYVIEMMKRQSLSVDDYTFTLTPVSLQTTTQTSSSYYYTGATSEYVNAIVPYVGTPVMAKINIDKAKIIFTFSKQVANF